MKVHLGDQHYEVSWEYEGERTWCYVFHVAVDRSRVIESMGTVARYHKDKDDRQVARKRSLKNALERFKRFERVEFWRAFLALRDKDLAEKVKLNPKPEKVDEAFAFDVH